MLFKSTDVLVVGAGIAGISAACHLRRHCPGRDFQIVEARQAIGGTWDLFRYPGIRSDTDMNTYGFSFKPWNSSKVFGGASDIKNYLQETVEEYKLNDQIHFGLRVSSISWSSIDALWTVTLESLFKGQTQTQTLTCKFVFMCSGYYNYEKGYLPDFPAIDSFQGVIAHPQHWPADLNYENKKVVVIGSGATAVTLIPAMAQTVDHITLLQRSPSYVAVRPAKDKVVDALRKTLPLKLAAKIIRARAILMGVYMHHMCRVNPEKAKAFFIGQVRRALGPDFDVETHFTPQYKPWDQRVCVVPDGDLFKAINSGKASITTDHIDRFTPTGILLKSGTTIDADIIIPATGLNLKMLGDIVISVDGKPFHINDAVAYKGVGYCELPNFVATFGYTKASWTLKADLTSLYFCRLLKYMELKGTRQFMPKAVDSTVKLVPWTDMASGYFQRSMTKLPKQGDKNPWQFNQAVIPDILALRFGKIDDGLIKLTV